MDAMIECDGLTKRFGSFTAVDHVSFSVARGSIFGFLARTAPANPPSFGCCAEFSNRPMARRASGAAMSCARGSNQGNDRLYVQKFSLYDELTVNENLLFSGKALQPSGPRPEKAARRADRAHSPRAIC